MPPPPAVGKSTRPPKSIKPQLTRLVDEAPAAKGRSRAIKIRDGTDGTARHFVYKLYEATDGQPMQWAAGHQVVIELAKLASPAATGALCATGPSFIRLAGAGGLVSGFSRETMRSPSFCSVARPLSSRPRLLPQSRSSSTVHLGDFIAREWHRIDVGWIAFVDCDCERYQTEPRLVGPVRIGGG